MAVSVSLYNGNQSIGVGGESIFNVTADLEKGAIGSFTFSSIFNQFTSNTLSNFVQPGKTIAMLSAGSFSMRGRVFSIGKGVSETGSVTICVEDVRGFLRDSFIWYSNEPDDYEPEEGEEPEEKFRAKKGDYVLTLVAAIVTNHNTFMTITDCLPYGRLSVSFDSSIRQQNPKLNSDLSLDGVSTYEALSMIFEDQGFEWDLISLTSSISITVQKKIINSSGGGLICTGRNLKAASKSINVQETYTAILPLGGYGYNGRRITLTNVDFSSSDASDKLSTDPTAIDRLIPKWDPERQETVDAPDGEREGILAINSTLVTKFGLHIKAVCYDSAIANSDIDDDLASIRAELVKLAKKDAEKLNNDIVEWSVDAVDLSAVLGGASFNRLYALYTIQDTINGISVSNCRLIKMHKDFDDPTNSTFTFETPTTV